MKFSDSTEMQVRADCETLKFYRCYKVLQGSRAVPSMHLNMDMQ